MKCTVCHSQPEQMEMIMADIEMILGEEPMHAKKKFDEDENQEPNRKRQIRDLKPALALTSLLQQREERWPRSSTPLQDSAIVLSGARIQSRTGAHCLPHPAKSQTGGEDAHITSSGPNGTLVAVLDGVGGWANVGVDSGVYSRTLAHQIELEFTAWSQTPLELQESGDKEKDTLEGESKPLVGILERAFAYMNTLDLQGSCTVCMGLLRPNGELHVLNVGDSGLRIFRHKAIVFATEEQQHSFNYPLQLGSNSDDQPCHGDYLVTDVQDGDIIVAASDGVWDNLWERELLGLVSDPSASLFSAGLDGLARRIVEAAQRRGGDCNFQSPFAMHAQRAGMRRYLGGKLDDTTAVVLRVSSHSDS